MIIAGFDEVGRGAWAGPLCVVGVSLDSQQLSGLKDSKQYSAKKRSDLTKTILSEAHSVGIAWSSNRLIDQDGLATALRQCFLMSAETLQADEYIVDGTVQYLPHLPTARCEAKADTLYPAVAAASIVAKHLRDTYMRHLHGLDVRYGFDAHVGYGTATHRHALAAHGPTPYHRLSFKGVIQ